MLPIFSSTIKEFMLMQTKWASQLNQLLGSPISVPVFLQNILLASGDNTINHLLGRPLQGWFVVRMQTAGVALYDKQSTNQMPDKTLVLNSSGVATISLMVF